MMEHAEDSKWKWRANHYMARWEECRDQLNKCHEERDMLAMKAESKHQETIKTESAEWKSTLMGQIVTVYKEYARKHEGDKKFWEQEEVQPRAGWVTGFRALQNGMHIAPDRYEQARLQVEETIACALVVYWPTYNPVRVPLDAFELGGKPRYTRMYDAE